ncbi:ATP-binding protein [Marivirga lumbricoides]
MKYQFLIFTLALTVIACEPGKKKESEEANEANNEEIIEVPVDPELVKLWETDTVLTTCESVLYDGENSRLFVSNIDGKPLDKDGKGFISILNLDGSIKTLKWASGLNAPKGMGISDGHLYVTDIDRIVAIDLETGKVAKEYTPEKAEFLNDITVADNAVYASDSNLGFIHKIENDELTTVTENASGVNGLLMKDGDLLVLDKNGFRSLNLDSREFTMVNDSVTGGDGLTVLNDSTYIASRWKGEIYYVTGNKAHLLLDTKAEESQTADIGLNASEKIVYVPTFFKNKVVAYEIKD